MIHLIMFLLRNSQAVVKYTFRYTTESTDFELTNSSELQFESFYSSPIKSD